MQKVKNKGKEDNKTDSTGEGKANAEQNKEDKKKSQDKEEEKKIQAETAKEKSPIKKCSVDMGHRVENKSPVKISSDKDSMICVTDSNSDVIITSEVDGKAVKADGGSVCSEASVSTNGGIYISDSAKENEKGDSANNLKEKKQENDESDGESGVYFSDSEEFERVMKNRREKKITKLTAQVKERLMQSKTKKTKRKVKTRKRKRKFKLKLQKKNRQLRSVQWIWAIGWKIKAL